MTMGDKLMGGLVAGELRRLGEELRKDADKIQPGRLGEIAERLDYLAGKIAEPLERTKTG